MPVTEWILLRHGRTVHSGISLLLHLSDLHLLSGAPEADAILGSLLYAIERERARRAQNIDLVVVSGDLFDTASVDPGRAAAEMQALLRCIDHALGRPTPTLLVPGNHDRRRLGLFGPHQGAIFSALRETLPPHVFVHGCETPLLARLVPQSHHGQPLLLARGIAHRCHEPGARRARRARIVGGMTQSHVWKSALTRAERFATEALHLTRNTTPHRSYAELSQRLDDAEAVLELLARADDFASLARMAEDADEAEERAHMAEALAREARDEAARRARGIEIVVARAS